MEYNITITGDDLKVQSNYSILMNTIPSMINYASWKQRNNRVDSKAEQKIHLIKYLLTLESCMK